MELRIVLFYPIENVSSNNKFHLKRFQNFNLSKTTSTIQKSLKDQFETNELINNPIKDGDYTIWTELDGIECQIQFSLAEDIPELEKSIPIGRFPFN